MVSRNPLNRRRFLHRTGKALALSSATVALWNTATSVTPTAVVEQQNEPAALAALGRTWLRLPGSRPFPERPAGQDCLPGIDHIIVLMLENHSFDNLLGMLGRGDGFTLDADGQPTASNPYPDGRVQHAFRMPTTCQLPGTPSQEWLASHNAFNGGANDGFVRTRIRPLTDDIVGGVAMGYWTGEDLPFTYSLAGVFPIADRWFSSTMGQTDPNRRYLIAGTSLGMTDNIGLGIGNLIPDLSLALPANGTIFTQLDHYGISWANYAADYPAGATPQLYPLNDTAAEYSRHRPLAQFFTDAAAGTLPAFSLLDPDYAAQSQENPQNIVVGEGLLAQVVRAVGASPLWPRTLFVLTYDENGGYYDHVPPPAALAPDAIPPLAQPTESTYDGFCRYGFRVPAVVVSPYAKPDHVSHLVYDHTSILATLARKWNLPALTYRDANANDLTDFLDLTALSGNKPTFPALPPLADPGDTPDSLVCSKNGPGTIPPLGSITDR